MRPLFLILGLVFLLLVIGASKAQTCLLPKDVQAAWGKAYRLEFDSEYKTAVHAIKIAQRHTCYVQHYTAFLKQLCFGVGAGSYTKQLLNQFKSLNQFCAWDYYCLSSMHLQQMILLLQTDERFEAFKHYRKAKDYLYQGENRFPDFQPYRFLKAIIWLSEGMVPERYQWLTKALGMRGDAKQAWILLSQLAYEINQNRFEPTFLVDEIRSIIYLLLANSDLEKSKANAIFSMLPPPASITGPLEAYALWILHRKTTLGVSLHTLARIIETASWHIAWPYLSLLLGEYYMPSDGQKAIQFFKIYGASVPLSGTQLRLKHRMAWSYLMAKDEQQYERLMQELASMPAKSEEDRLALWEWEHKAKPNEALLKARLFFDNGDYGETWSQLKLYNRSTYPAHEAEYFYRLGRYLEVMGKNSQAENAYRAVRACLRPDRTPYYFQANAFYHLGLLAMTHGRANDAIYWFEEVLAYPEHPYKSSLDAKARLQLTAVKSGFPK